MANQAMNRVNPMPWQERLWKAIKLSPGDGCWVFGMGRSASGYGKFSIDGKATRAHRAAWESAYGPIPAEALVLHKCDNPPCCRPDHLFLGTAKDNAVDRENKGRRSILYGENSARAKLSNVDVSKIRGLAGTRSHGELGRMFGVSRSNISYILSGKGRVRETLKAAAMEAI